MIKVENIHIDGFEAAVRGMRNPKNSWAKSDSSSCFNLGKDCPEYCPYAKGEDECTGPYNLYLIGPNDMELMHTLYLSGPEHAKCLRMIHVSMDVTAPLYWWKEADQYKVGTTTNSCSTMHKIAAKEFTLDDFSREHLTEANIEILNATIAALNDSREWYLKYDYMSEEDKKHFDSAITCKKDLWWQMIQLLPSTYNQKRTWDFDYQTLFNIINQRTNHKLDEWKDLVKIMKTLPYVKEIGGFTK